MKIEKERLAGMQAELEEIFNNSASNGHPVFDIEKPERGVRILLHSDGMKYYRVPQGPYWIDKFMWRPVYYRRQTQNMAMIVIGNKMSRFPYP